MRSKPSPGRAMRAGISIARICLSLAILLSRLAVRAEIAHADLYGYTDSDGTYHVVEHPANIPERFREGARKQKALPHPALPGSPAAAPAQGWNAGGGEVVRNASSYALSATVLKRVEFHYSGKNAGGRTISEVKFLIGVPISLPGQEIQSLSWSPEPTGYVEDRFGQRLADFRFRNLAPGQAVVARLTVAGRFSRIRHEVDPGRVGGLAEVPREVADLYTTDGQFYRLGDPEIVRTAREVVGNERNPYQIALRIHDFVARKLDYETPNTLLDAVSVFKQGRGSCSEFTVLFISLARACGLPARFAGGSYWKDDRAVGYRKTDKRSHRWAEVFLPNYGWVPFDSTWDKATNNGPVGREHVAAHAPALIMVRGGGTDEQHMGMEYMAKANYDGILDRDWGFIWSDP